MTLLLMTAANFCFSALCLLLIYSKRQRSRLPVAWLKPPLQLSARCVAAVFIALAQWLVSEYYGASVGFSILLTLLAILSVILIATVTFFSEQIISLSKGSFYLQGLCALSYFAVELAT